MSQNQREFYLREQLKAIQKELGEGDDSNRDIEELRAKLEAAGMTEAEYTRITYDATLAAANVLARLSPTMTFIYVSGAGTDSTEQKRAMWARVKGKTENALLALPFKAVMFRSGLIRPLHGIRSKTRMYRLAYAALWPLFPVLSLFGALTTTERVGRAMLRVAREGSPTKLVTNREIDQLAA